MCTIRKSITILLLTSLLLSLAGCATSSKHGVLPNDGPTMSQIYNQQIALSGGSGQVTNIRKHLPRPKYFRFVKADHNLNQPRILPNPIIKIYVYPHFDEDDQDYVPGHLAYTTLYKKTHFALLDES